MFIHPILDLFDVITEIRRNSILVVYKVGTSLPSLLFQLVTTPHTKCSNPYGCISGIFTVLQSRYSIVSFSSSQNSASSPLITSLVLYRTAET